MKYALLAFALVIGMYVGNVGTPDGQALTCLLDRTRTLEDLARRTYRVLPILAGRVGGVGMAKLLTDYDSALDRPGEPVH